MVIFAWLAEHPKIALALIVGIVVIGIFGYCDSKREEREAAFESCSRQYIQGDYEGSLQCFGTYIAEEGESYDVLIWRGYSTLRLGLHELAHQDFESASTKYLKLPQALIALGDLWDEVGDQDRAIEFYDKALEYYKDGTGSLIAYLAAVYSKASIYEGRGDLEPAREQYDKALNQYFKDGKWQFTKNNLMPKTTPYIHFMGLEEALSKYAVLSEKLGHPEAAEVHFYYLDLSRCMKVFRNDDFSGAAACFKELVNKSLDPPNVSRVISNTFSAVGSMHQVQQWDGIAEMASLAMEVADPSDPSHKYHELLSWRAIGNRELGLYEDALRDVDESIAMKGDYPMPYATRGMIMQKQSQHPKALEDFSIAISLAHGWKEERKEGSESYLSINLSINQLFKDIFQYQAESYRAIGRVKEADEAQEKSENCQKKIKQQKLDLKDDREHHGFRLCD